MSKATVKTRDGRVFVLPTNEEDAAITAAANSDPDCPVMSDEDFKKVKPRIGRPLGSGKKEQLTVRFDTDVIQAFKESGDGWQTRMNDALRDWLQHHPKPAAR